MLDALRGQLTDEMSLEEKVNLVRENLQILLLKILYDLAMYKHIAFLGGTALRILFDLKRFSEDLDFSLIKKEGYNFQRLVNDIHRQLANYGIKVSSKVKDQSTVHSAMFKFEELLYHLNLSPLKSQKLFVKFEIDTNPPQGFHTEISLLSRFYTITITHYDLASLYAGKLHACFFRTYTKGRDFYDLLWYLGKKIKPNFKMLNNAIQQSQGVDLNITEDNFVAFLKKRIAQVDFEMVRKEVERFLVNKEELNLLDKEVILKILK